MTGIKILQLRDFQVRLYDHLGLLLREVRRRHGDSWIREGNPEWSRLKRRLSTRLGHAGFSGGNIRSSLRSLGLVDDGGLTDLGERVLSKDGQPEALKRIIASHVLITLNQWAFCYVLDHVETRDRTDIQNLYKQLFNPDEPSHLVNISHFNNFLSWLGIGEYSRFTFNRSRFTQLTGWTIETSVGLTRISDDAKLCLAALISEARPLVNREIVKRVLDRTGKSLDTHRLRQYALELRDLGLIRYGHRGHSTQRRGQSGEWSPNWRKIALLRPETVEGLQGLDRPLVDTERIRGKSLADLHSDALRATSKAAKGHALEDMVARICTMLGYDRIVVRDRNTTGRIELDLLATKDEPLHLAMQVQCKHTGAAVGPSVLARELGEAILNHRDIILLVTLSAFSPQMYFYRKEAVRKTGIRVLLLDGQQLQSIADGSEAFNRVFDGEELLNARLIRGDEAEDRFWLRKLVLLSIDDMTHEHGRPPKLQDLVLHMIRRGHLGHGIDLVAISSILSEKRHT